MEKIILDIIDIDDNARGIAKHEGLIYFVNGGILGEKLEAEILEKKKNFIIANKIETIEKSKYLEKQIDPTTLCGIYDLAEFSYENQVLFKKNSVKNTINRISKESFEDIEFVKANNIYGYRNKVELKVSINGELGYFLRNTNIQTNASNCIMNSIEIQKAVKILQELITKHQIPGYDNIENIGVIKNIILRSTTIGQLMCILIIHGDHDFSSFYKELENTNLFTSFYVSHNTVKNNYKIKGLNLVFGIEKIKEVLGDRQFMISPKAFMQVNPEVSYEIYMKAKELIQNVNPDILLDMFSGISTTSILLSESVKKIISVELNEDAVNDGIQNAKLNNVSNIEFVCDYAEKAIDEINLEDSKLACLFDPPRKGLDKNIIDKVGKSKISDVVYISCNPATLARDILRFKEYGYYLENVIAYDQFVHTLEVEVVTHLKRK